MRFPNLQPFASAFREYGASAAAFVMRALLEPAPDRPPVTAPIPAPVRVVIPPHVPCKIYYPRRSILSPDQLAFYLYWRDQFEAGSALPADATYRFLYANESAVEAKSAQELDARWSSLCRAYLSDDRFASYIASWVLDLRFLMDRFVVDDVVNAHHDMGIRLDVELLAKTQPTWRTVVGAVVANPSLAERLADFLADGYAEMGSIVSLAGTAGTRPVHENFFQGLPTAPSIARLVKIRQERPSFLGNPTFREPIEVLIAQASKTIGIETELKGRGAFVVTASTEVRVPIVRTTLPIRPEPAADTLDGILSIVRHGLDDDARMLIAVVIASSERLPYVEGRVDAAKSLRESFEAFSLACGRKATLGHFRAAFFELGRGPRALWNLEPPVAAPIDIKMNQVVARFTKGLQHALSGTLARRAVIECVLEVLSKRTARPTADLVGALATICGATSSILPSAKSEAAL